MTVKDGFKLGIGIFLAQLFLGIVALAISLPVLYVVGSTVKDKATGYLLGAPTQGMEDGK